MEKAAELLSTGRVTVREVAGRVGYSQHAQFAKAFRLHHGLSPSEYRDTPAARAAETSSTSGLRVAVEEGA